MTMHLRSQQGATWQAGRPHGTSKKGRSYEALMKLKNVFTAALAIAALLC